MRFNITIDITQETAQAYALKNNWDSNPETLEHFMTENIKSELADKITAPAVEEIYGQVQIQVLEQAQGQIDTLKDQVKENISVEVVSEE